MIGEAPGLYNLLILFDITRETRIEMPLQQIKRQLSTLIILCCMILPTLAVAKTIPGPISHYPFEGYLYLAEPDQGTIPASGDTVWAFNQARDDSVFAVTDALGFYHHAPVTSVGDVPRLQTAMLGRVYPNPDPRAVELLLPAGQRKTAAEASLRFYNLRGQDVTRREHLGAGSYLVRAFLSGEHIGTAKFLVTDGRFQHREMTRTVSVATGPGKSAPRMRLAPLEADFVFTSSGYRPTQLSILLDPAGTVLPDVTLLHESHMGTVLVHGRTGDEIGNLLVDGGAWRFTNTSSGDEYLAPLDGQGYWSVSLPDTIPDEREFTVEFTGNSEFRTGTFTFMSPYESSVTGVRFTSVDFYQPKVGWTTKQILAQEHLALTFSQASAQNDTIKYMIRGYGNPGVSKLIVPERTLYSRRINLSTGEYVSAQRLAQQRRALEFVQDHATSLPGTISHPYVSSVGPVLEVDWDIPSLLGAVIVYTRDDVNAGNLRGPPPGYPTYTTAIGFVRSNDPGNKVITEIIEALGVYDYVHGHGAPAYTYDEDGQIAGLSHIGQVVLSFANTYLPGDGKVE